MAVISDGVIEARNAEREQFGAERAAEVLRTAHQESAAKILLAVRAGVEEFDGGIAAADDRTILILKRTA